MRLSSQFGIKTQNGDFGYVRLLAFRAFAAVAFDAFETHNTTFESLCLDLKCSVCKLNKLLVNEQYS